MADFSALSSDDDVTFAKWLASDVGVATVPGSSFFRPGSEDGRRYVRFAFCKKMETMERAVERLATVGAMV